MSHSVKHISRCMLSTIWEMAENSVLICQAPLLIFNWNILFSREKGDSRLKKIKLRRLSRFMKLVRLRDGQKLQDLGSLSQGICAVDSCWETIAIAWSRAGCLREATEPSPVLGDLSEMQLPLSFMHLWTTPCPSCCKWQSPPPPKISHWLAQLDLNHFLGLPLVAHLG